MELEEERLEVRSKTLSRVLSRGLALVSYLVPSRPRLWIPGLGWLEWPTVIGPHMRQKLKSFQINPLALEQLLQTRTAEPDEQRLEYPRDEALKEAVSRMTQAARTEKKMGLVLSTEEWQQLVSKHLSNPGVVTFAQEITERVGGVQHLEDLNRWLGLAMNIWNATPQPDRGGKTAYEMSKEGLRGFE